METCVNDKDTVAYLKQLYVKIPTFYVCIKAVKIGYIVHANNSISSDGSSTNSASNLGN